MRKLLLATVAHDPMMWSLSLPARPERTEEPIPGVW